MQDESICYDLRNIFLGVVCAVVGWNNGEMNAITVCSIPTNDCQSEKMENSNILPKQDWYIDRSVEGWATLQRAELVAKCLEIPTTEYENEYYCVQVRWLLF